MSSQQVFSLQKAVRSVSRHPEYVGCATVAVLIGLALVQTDWVPYARQPGEIMDRVLGAQTGLDQAVWPESERERFVYGDVAAVIDARIPRERYVTSGLFTTHLGRVLRLQEPELEPVRHLVAARGRVLLEFRPEGAPAPAVTPEIESEDAEPWLDELRRQRASRDRRDSTTDMLETPWYDAVMAPGDEFVVMPAASRVGHAYPFVAVRGLFDASAQVSAIADAVHRRGDDVAKLLELIDFYLERQTFDQKQNAWSSWEPVDVQVFKDLALRANGFEPDVVPSWATDAVITCPLLMRITGRWETLATHPLLQNGQLSPGELEREADFLEAVLALQNEARQPRRGTIDQRGFTGLIRDARSLEEDLFDPVLSSAAATSVPRANFGIQAGLVNMNRGNPAVEEMVRKIAARMDPKQTDRELRDWIRERMTQGARRQILFRYFDFDVEPGATYRYQVRLELRNPNFGRPLAAASAAHVVEGETRLTPWSEPTAPVTVERNVRYFLAGLEDSRYRQNPRARMKVFQYDTDLGTLVEQELPVELGQRIAGTARAILLDPAGGVQKEEDYEFRSHDTLLDALPDLEFDRNQHPDLQLPGGSLGAARVPEYALVRADDELRTIDPRSQGDELARQERYLELQRDQLQHLRSDAEAEGWDDEYERMMYEEVFGQSGGEEEQQPARRRRNLLQRR